MLNLGEVAKQAIGRIVKEAILQHMDEVQELKRENAKQAELIKGIQYSLRSCMDAVDELVEGEGKEDGKDKD